MGFSGFGTCPIVEAEFEDLRAAIRFPVEHEVRYTFRTGKVVNMGFGRTIDISSNGVLFTAQDALAVGQRIEVAIDWPVLLDNHCPLRLVTVGRVIRSEGRRTAIAIDRCEFRTRGVARIPPRHYSRRTASEGKISR